MKFITLLCICFVSVIYSQSKDNNPVPFIENTAIQFPNVRDVAITANENEVIFSAQSVMGDVSALVYVRKNKEGWSTPEVLSFSGQYFDIEPFFSSDGLALYFASNRPLNETSSESKDFDIWYATRTSISERWSEPQNLGAPINTEKDEFYPVITDSKNIYFTLDNLASKRKDDIYLSEFKDGTYTTPKPLGNAINSEGYEFNAFISPDESFLIYSCYNRKDGFGSGDLYISYKNDNNEWSESKNMGNTINSDKMDYCPFVDTNSKTLYFTSKRNATRKNYTSRMTTEELKKVFSSYKNGASRLYKMKMPELKTKD
ncbi:PD40 domain-containing protein [Psychroserpens jangbogonensis]|uniref:PD40 domain-containing protein n=1 Tax=Psychroserpens jangbogonensis TaxID=1484460 RepID=UPI0006905E93|nr:PD40 domain-containing protein [Psychroserpens jangbogonensis]